MYTVEEKPTVEIELVEYREIYRKNIEAIIKMPHMDRIIYKTTRNTSSVWHSFIQEQIKTYSQKEFYLQGHIYKRIESFSNCKEYSIFCPEEITKSDLATLLFLRINMDVEFGEREYENIKHVLDEKKHVCVVFLDCKNKISGIKYQETMKRLQKLSCLGDIYLSNTFISVDAILQHPCNAYLCSGNKCHSGKSPYPRYLFVNHEGVFPYGCMNKRLKFFDNISTEEIGELDSCFEEEYLKSEAYISFITANQEIYRSYIVYSLFQVIPWNVFLEKVIK